MFDVCVIGHVARDVIAIQQREHAPRPGGTAYYSSVVYRSLGLSVAVVTKVAAAAAGELLGHLGPLGIEVFNLHTETTTTFRNEYAPENPDIRMQRVGSLAGTIRLDELPPVEARIYHVGPLTKSDIDLAILGECTSRGGAVALDAQGLTRDIVHGSVQPSRTPEIGDYLHAVDVLQADKDEIIAFTGARSVAEGARMILDRGVREVTVTKASQGSHVFWSGGKLDVDAIPPRSEVDATGCGDTYLAAYMARRMTTDNRRASADYASLTASLNIETLGPFRGTEIDILARWAELGRPPFTGGRP